MSNVLNSSKIGSQNNGFAIPQEGPILPVCIFEPFLSSWYLLLKDDSVEAQKYNCHLILGNIG